MVDFTPFHAARSKDGCVYNKARKTYTRNKPIPTGFKRITGQPRIKAAIIKLSVNFGYSTNQIAAAFGRSRSYVHKCVRTAILRGLTHFIDKRKLPSSTRLRCSSIRRKTLSKYIIGWIKFANGEVDKPP